ncbi:hypothetical protein CY34DRAFT_16332 [Suillus luteus UH-Slu-Lm8-n1]|uniref:Uncharacterized protein n=1 Tax=Suillus luteus UH-Slu-Lm8-n1 TaxID=930992 RepID=A0A0D0AXE4_9AGAM|nr:hypothetical protein CY34DRAFT_16332 [Suillus luteus UH-Slu-Lm8-n1]
MIANEKVHCFYFWWNGEDMKTRVAYPSKVLCDGLLHNVDLIRIRITETALKNGCRLGQNHAFTLFQNPSEASVSFAFSPASASCSARTAASTLLFASVQWHLLTCPQ